jgi:hypothetical protein
MMAGSASRQSSEPPRLLWRGVSGRPDGKLQSGREVKTASQLRSRHDQTKGPTAEAGHRAFEGLRRARVAYMLDDRAWPVRRVAGPDRARDRRESRYTGSH